MLKVNNKDTRTTPGVVLVCLLLTLNIFYTFYTIVNFEQVNAGWEDKVMRISYTSGIFLQTVIGYQDISSESNYHLREVGRRISHYVSAQTEFFEKSKSCAQDIKRFQFSLTVTNNLRHIWKLHQPFNQRVRLAKYYEFSWSNFKILNVQTIFKIMGAP